jgi:HlyD family secretion protein
VKRWLRRLPILVIGLGVVGLIVYAFLPKPVDVDVATVSRGRLQVTVAEDGKTRIKDRYVVSSPLAGRLLRIQLKAGDRVEANQTLLTSIEPTDPALLDPRALAESEARVRAAEAGLNKAGPAAESALAEMQFAESEFGRVDALYKQGATPKHEHEQAALALRTKTEAYRAAKFAEEIAQFELELAKAALLRTAPQSNGTAMEQQFEIRAPITGRVLRVFQESATVVAPADELLELGDPTDLEIEIDVLSSDAVKIHPGSRVLLDQWGGDETLIGSVRLVEPSAFTKISALGVEEQRVNVIADFLDPREKWSTLGDAFRVEARVVIWEADDVLRVPTSALFRHGDEWAVFVVADGRARLRPVQTGHRNTNEAEVLDGLEEGDEVVVHPSDKVADGVAVRRR